MLRGIYCASVVAIVVLFAGCGFAADSTSVFINQPIFIEDQTEDIEDTFVQTSIIAISAAETITAHQSVMISADKEANTSPTTMVTAIGPKPGVEPSRL